MSVLDIVLDILLNPWVILSLIFWVIVIVLIRLLRNKKEAYYLWFPMLAMFKTKKLNRFLTKLGKKAPKFWKVFWTIGIFVSFCFTIFALYFFFTNFINLIIAPSPEQGIYPLIPGVTVSLPVLAYLILPLLFILTTHEFAHGISAAAEGVEIKSTGFLGAGIFVILGFGAFVEVDERVLSSQKFHRNTRFRIAAAGTYVNGMTAGVAFLLLINFPLIIAPYYTQVAQVKIVSTEADGGFNFGNLTEGDVILAIKKRGAADDEYVSLDYYAGKTLDDILNNRTSLQCSVGDNLTFSIYSPSTEVYSEKNITLGPLYNIGILFEYISNTELQITKIYSASDGGNNYNKNLTVGLIITEVNGVPINQSNGDKLEKALTEFHLNTINLSTASDTYVLDVEEIGVKIGIYSFTYFMHKNAFAKSLTPFWPEFWLREIVWLYVISFSITLFNMLPLPVFDGDRMIKELINWGFGEEYKTTKKKKEKILYKKDEKDLNLSEYRIEKVDSVRILLEDQTGAGQPSEIILAEDKYTLIDKIGDGFKDTVSLNIPEHTQLEEGSLIEISYEYWHDEKQKIKKTLINTLRLITLFILAGNFILSFVRFGGLLFWI